MTLQAFHMQHARTRPRTYGRHRVVTPVLIMLAAASLAGCIDAGDPEALDAPTTATPDVEGRVPIIAEDGRDLATDLRPTDTLDAPQWRIGDWFGHHVFFGSSDGEGQHINTIVTEASASGYHMVTDDEAFAKLHGIVDIPLMGDIGPGLESTGLGGAWDIFEFPMSHGSTWTGEIPNGHLDVVDSDTIELTFNASYDPAIETTGGTFPGFGIVGTIDDGTIVVEADYIPAIGWYGSFTVYDIDPDQDPVEFHVISMGFGSDWTGTWYDATADQVLVQEYMVIVTPDQQAVEPVLPSDFDLSSSHTHLGGFIVAVAVAGAQEIIITDPEGNAHEVRAIGAPEEVAFWQPDVPAVPGTWHVAPIGAGAVAYAYLEIYGITLETGTL